MQDIFAYIDQNHDRYIRELSEFLAFPSVSTQAKYKPEVINCAEWLSDHLTQIGLPSQVYPTARHPVVMGQRCEVPNAPTVLYYGHYDVQPPEPLDLWDSPPFEPTIRDDSIFARGATDNKGQLFTHIKALEALLQIRGALPLNVKWIFEGEEEIASPSLGAFISQHRQELACDRIIISDTGQFEAGKPAITYGLKGLIALELVIKGPDRDLHSGGYGGSINNPINVLTRVMARFQDDNGTILVPGFYDRVRPLADWEREEYARLAPADADFCDFTGAPETWGEPGFTTLERRWARPTFDINGITGGYEDDGFKTVLPASARAKFSFRLVPDQDPQAVREQVLTYLQELIPSSVTYETFGSYAAKPVLVDTDHPDFQAAKRAVHQVFGRDPVMVRTGGSIPVVNTFRELLGVDSLLLGWALPDDNEHSPNEKFNLTVFNQAIKTSAILLGELCA